MKLRVTIVVLGHVDHGKSTLVGRYLFEKGLVHPEVIERYAELGARMGKAAFKYAWVMDQSDESRRRGLTLDLNFADVETRNREIHIIDAPGHKDFLRSMITGTTGADAALLVVDSQEGIMPQTSEHARLAKLMGIDRMIVAVNKIDKTGYNPEAIAAPAAELKHMLGELGFEQIDIIPVSAWDGQNLTGRGAQMAWYRGRTLEEVFDGIEPRGGHKDGTLRMPVMQVLQIGGVGTVVLGRIERGDISEGDEVVISPTDKVATVRSIEAYGKTVRRARSGETVGVALRGIARQDISRGDVLGVPDDPPRIAEEFTAKIVLFGNVGVVKPGWSPYVHCHSAAVPVRLEAIEMKFRPDSGEASDGSDTGFLQSGDAALVRLRPLKPLIIENAEKLPGMARLAVRAGKDTLGAGSCVSVKIAATVAAVPGATSQGFSYKHVKVGRGAKDLKTKKDGENRDIWGKAVKK